MGQVQVHRGLLSNRRHSPDDAGRRVLRTPIRVPGLTTILVLLLGFSAGGQVVVPFGYIMGVRVEGGLASPTAMAEDDARRLYIVQYGPGGTSGGVKIVIPPRISARDFATIPQLDDPAGIVIDGTRVLVSNRASGVVGVGQVVEYTDKNGNLNIDDESEFQILISDLPQGLNGTRALALGNDDMFYVGQGSITNSSPDEPLGLNTTVFRFDSANPMTRIPFASGLYNPLGVLFDHESHAFITDRSLPQEDGPDELNYAEGGEFFGFGIPAIPSTPTEPPLVEFPHFASPAGVAHFLPSGFTGGREVVYVALEGHPAGLPEPPPKVVEVVLHRENGTITTTEVNDFVIGMDRPFGLLRVSLGTGAEALLISDFDADLVYQVRRRGEDDPPDLDVDRSGRVDSGDLLVMMQERFLLLRGNPPEFLRTDFNHDEKIDAYDLFIFSAGWEGDSAE
jgi:hypothetical protein